jgi:hypothetical protein
MTNWKTFVNKDSAKRFVLPPGWDSREVIADQLECSPDRVREVLAPAIRSGEVEVKQFPVWDAKLGRKVMVTAFRTVTAPVKASG